MNTPSSVQRSLLETNHGNEQYIPYVIGEHPHLRDFAATFASDEPPVTPDTLPQSQTVSRSGSLYNVHSYWSKKPYLAIERFIEHYTRRGGLVFDPFCGCGSTLQASLGTGRRAIGLDLSPSASHIAANTTRRVNREEFHDAGRRILRSVQRLVEPLYLCDIDGSQKIIASLVHSEQVRCKKCLHLFPIIAEGTTSAKSACPHCDEPFSTRSKNLEFGPAVVVAVEVRDSWSSKRGKLRWLHEGAQYTPVTSDNEVHGRAEKIRQTLRIPVPERLIELGGRLATTGSTTLGMLHEDRSLCALDALRDGISNISNEPLNAKMLLAFTSILTNCSKLYRFRKGGGGGAIGAYYVPPIRRELNPLFGFAEKLKTIDTSLMEIVEWDECNYLISNQPSQKVDLPSESMDYVFTDPPYADTMPYGALNFIWDGWLNQVPLSEYEAIGDSWKSVMKGVFLEVHRVLKPEAFCSVCYHDTSEGTWADLLDVMAECGFRPVIGKDVLFIETNQKAYQQTVADKVVKRDHVVNFVKVADTLELGGVRKTHEIPFTEMVQHLIGDFLTENPGSTKDWIYDHIITRLIQEERLEPHEFETILASVAEENVAEGEKKRGLWYTKDEHGKVDKAEVERENSAANRLEVFMKEWCESHPEMEGVHYSELFAEYLLEQSKPRRRLAEWLHEFFYKTEEGTWRPPADEAER